MKTKLFLLAILAIAISFSACNKEEALLTNQEELIPEKEQTEQDIDISADLEQSAEAIIRSLDLSMKGLPAYVSEITLTPQGAIDPNGETRVVIVVGSFTSLIRVKAQDLASGENLATSTISGSGFMGSTPLTIPAYNTSTNTASRVIGFFYLGSTNQWELFHYETQAPSKNTVQKPFSVIPLDNQPSYVADGNSYSFEIQANKGWQATILKNPENVLERVITTSGKAGIQNFVFKTNKSGKSGIATVRFTSGNEFQDIQIYCKAAGSFIVVPSLKSSYKADGKSYSFDLYLNEMAWVDLVSGKEFIKSHQVVTKKDGTSYTFTTNVYKANGKAFLQFKSVETGETQLVAINFTK